MLRRRKTAPEGGAETEKTAVQQPREPTGPAPPRERPGVRARMAAGGAGVIAAFGTGVARLIRLAVLVVVLIIALAIAFKVLGANSHNTIVSAVHDGGKALAKPFDDMFKIDGANATLALNWGIALVVYLVIGLAVARFVARLAAIRPVARRRRPVAHG
jgi:hypothetical protein